MTFLFLSTLTISVKSYAGPSCEVLFGVLSSEEIVSKATIAARLQIYMEHQNQLRAKAGLKLIPQKEIDDAVSRYKESNKSKNSREGFVKYIQQMHYEKDWLLPTPKVDDSNLLNYVYQFDGVKLVRAIPALEYFLEKQPSETITLYRAVGDIEFKYWKNKNVAAMKEKAKTIQQWGYKRPRLHFSANVPGRLYVPTVSLTIPKLVLLEWGRRGFVSTGKEGSVTEIVLLRMFGMK